MPSPPETIRVLGIYAAEDEALWQRVEAQARELAGRIPVGRASHCLDRSAETPGAERAEVVLVLVSPALLASGWPAGAEAAWAVERHLDDKAVVLPIIAEPAEWGATPLGMLHALPRDGRPISTWGDPDEGVRDAALAIRRALVSIALRRLRRELPAAFAVLASLAFLAPREVPREILCFPSEHLPVRYRLLAELHASGLADATEETVAMPASLQAAVRLAIGPAERSEALASAIRLLALAFPYDSDDAHAHPLCERLLPHALAAIGHAEALVPPQPALSRLLNQAGLYAAGL